jgi:ATP-dependent helicase Lhr and Lhr-like helicase
MRHLLTESVDGPRLLLLGGRSWKVTHIDWDRRRCFVQEVDGGGRAKWSGVPGGLSYDITHGMRDVLFGGSPEGVTFTWRASTVLAGLRAGFADTVDSDRLIAFLPSDSTGRWWTWAGTAANRTLQVSLPSVIDPRQRIDEKSLRLLPAVTVAEFSAALAAVEWRDPDVDANALRGLKFSAALPPELATQALGARLGDESAARAVVVEPRLIVR